MIVEKIHSVKLKGKSYVLYQYPNNLWYNKNGGLDVKYSKTSIKYD